MTDIDTTMQAFLGVYRADVNALEQTVQHLQSFQADLERRLSENRKAADAAERKLKGTLEARHEDYKRIEKLEGIIESLKIELQNERAAHTEARESHTEPERGASDV